MTQTQQVINVMRNLGGFATFGQLNSSIDFSSWKTKTPEANVRRIVQESSAFFRIQPGLWALVDCKAKVFNSLNLDTNTNIEHLPENFTHSYYQGLIIEIGNIRRFETFVPSQDKNRSFLGRSLKVISSLQEIHKFTYDSILRFARMVDAVWSNERKMPQAFFEVENTTDIKNSLSKFYELQDFNANFYIVAPNYRQKKFDDDISRSQFREIRDRVLFITYEKLSTMHTKEHEAFQVRYF